MYWEGAKNMFGGSAKAGTLGVPAYSAGAEALGAQFALGRP